MREFSEAAVYTEESLDDRPLKELVAAVGRDMGLLMRQEIQLAKAEVDDKMRRVTTGAVSIGIGAFLAYAGMLAIVAALVLIAIAIGLSPWLASALIGVLLIGAGYGAINAGKRRAASGPPPLQRTRENAKETVQEIKEHLR